MRCFTIWVLLFVWSNSAIGQLPDAIKMELIDHLDTLSQGAVPSSAERADQIFELYESQPLTVWEDFFKEYFSKRSFSNGLNEYLINPTFFTLTEKVRSNLQGGLLPALIALQDSMMANSADLSVSLNTDLDFRISLVNINHFFNFYLKYPGNTAAIYFPELIEYYLVFIQKYNQFFSKKNPVDLVKYPFLGIIKSQIYANVASYNYLDRTRKEAIAQVIGLGDLSDTLQQKLWIDHNILLADNGLFDERQKSVLLKVLAIIPSELHQIVNINVTEVIREDLNAISSIGGINLYNNKVGSHSEDGFPREGNGHSIDLFTLVFLHELNHSVSAYGLDKRGHYLASQQGVLVNAAGSEPLNYLRSINAPGFFVETPQELFASTANMYMANTQLSFEIALERFHLGRHQPLDQFLLLANTYSNDTDSTFFITVDKQANFEVHYARVEKDADGYITSLWLSEFCAYHFSLDQNKFVTNLEEPMASPEIPDNGIDEDCDGLDQTTAVYNISGARLNIFPNPSSGSLLLEADPSLKLKYDLYSLEGKILQSGLANDRLVLDGLDNGIYILKVTDPVTKDAAFEKIVLAK